MTRTILTTFALIAVTATPLLADHEHNARYRTLDDMAFAAFADARELRWEIHDDFVTSKDYDHLLEDADAIISSLRNVQATIYRERPDSLIARDLAVTYEKIANLSEHMESCDFARVRPAQYQMTFQGRGYRYSPETRNVGRIHVEAALKLIARVERTLDQLAYEVGLTSHHHHGGPAVGTPPIPVPPVRQQTHAQPGQRPVRNVFSENMGGVTFSFGF